MHKLLLAGILIFYISFSQAQINYGWYTEGVAIIDPKLAGNPEPTVDELRKIGGYLMRKESNGHSIPLQIDDIDKDGIWDELFFLTDLAPREIRQFYIYTGWSFGEVRNDEKRVYQLCRNREKEI